MKNIIEVIHKAKHIVVTVPSNPTASSVGSASALYTYILTLHKKVSFFCPTKDIEGRLSFIPWFDKIKSSFPSSANLVISFDFFEKQSNKLSSECEFFNIDEKKPIESLFHLFKENRITINKKMATALYSGLLFETDNFLNGIVNGTIFAIAKELIESGADIKLCNKFITRYVTLGAFRLKAMMQNKMLLIKNAKIAMFIIKDSDIKATGAIETDCEMALKEALSLPTVEVALLFKQNTNLSVEGFFISDNKKYIFNFIDETEIEKVKEKVLKLIYKETKVE